jgi:methylase of polypeptide subunit release factors
MDHFYTPSELAAFLAGAAKQKAPECVADFAMGDGALLRAARQRWPRARLIGSDIRSSAIDDAFSLSDAETHICDFLSAEENIPSLRHVEQACDVILLNPPFTCKGNERYSALVDNSEYRGSKALAFVARAIRYLKPTGEIVAILPASCATSLRDRELLQSLSERYCVEQVGELNRNAFPGCSVSVLILRIRIGTTPKSRRPAPPPTSLTAMRDFQAELMRGVTPIYRTGDVGTIPVLHTTDLRLEKFVPTRWISGSRRLLEGTAIVLPRVGRPDRSKLMLIETSAVELSDCIFALRASPIDCTAELFRLMTSSWPRIEASYGGSCAPYLTLMAVRGLLSELGVLVTNVEDMRHALSDRGDSCRLLAG